MLESRRVGKLIALVRDDGAIVSNSGHELRKEGPMKLIAASSVLRAVTNPMGDFNVDV
ncbi:MAG: hypothetical protein ACLQVG_23580 [Terriglobia bacterium]